MLDSQKVTNEHQAKLDLIDINFDQFVEQHLEQMITYLANDKLNKFDSTLAIDSKGNLLITKKSGTCDTRNMYCIKYRFSPILRHDLNNYDFAIKILKNYQRYLIAKFKQSYKYVNKTIFINAEDFPEEPMFTSMDYINYCFSNLDKLTSTNDSLPTDYAITYYPDYFVNKALVSLQLYDHITFKMWQWITNCIINLPKDNPASIVLFKKLCNIFNNQFSDKDYQTTSYLNYAKFISHCDLLKIKQLRLPIKIILHNLNEIERLNYTKIILNLQTKSDVNQLFETIHSISWSNRMVEQQVLATFLLNVIKCQITDSARNYLQTLQNIDNTFDYFVDYKIQEYILNHH